MVRWWVFGICLALALGVGAVYGMQYGQSRQQAIEAARPTATARVVVATPSRTQVTAFVRTLFINTLATSRAAPTATPRPAETPAPTDTAGPTDTPLPTVPPGTDPQTYMTAHAVGFQAEQPDPYDAPPTGFYNAVVHISIANNGNAVARYSMTAFAVRGTVDNVRYQARFDTATDNTSLGSGSLAPGDTVAGAVAFQIPTKRQEYYLIWTPNLEPAIYVPWKAN